MTAPVLAVGAPEQRPLPRLLPAPRTEPPFDDELEAPPVTGWAHEQGAVVLPLTFGPRRLAAATGFGPRRTGRSELPDPRRWCGRLVQALLEALLGARPARQLSPWASGAVIADLERRCAAIARRRGRAPALRPLVRSVHVGEPADGVAEACAVVRFGGRTRAVALRLEGVDGRWRCTALQVC